MSSVSTVRTHVVIPKDIISDVDRLVGPRRRSNFFEEAVRKELKRIKLTAAAKKAAGSLKDVDIPGWETPTTTAKWVHDVRHESDRKLDWK